jgi:hypothetical protein
VKGHHLRKINIVFAGFNSLLHFLAVERCVETRDLVKSRCHIDRPHLWEHQILELNAKIFKFSFFLPKLSSGLQTCSALPIMESKLCGHARLSSTWNTMEMMQAILSGSRNVFRGWASRIKEE